MQQEKKHVTWQGRAVETDAASLAAFLEEQGVKAAGAVVEHRGEVYAPGADLSAVPLADGDAVAAFAVVAGG